MREAQDRMFHTDVAANDRVMPVSGQLRVISQHSALGSRVLFNANLEQFVHGFLSVKAWKHAAITRDTQEPGTLVLGSANGTLSIGIDLAEYPALRILAGGVSATVEVNLRNTVASALLAPLLQQLGAAVTGTWRVVELSRGHSDEWLAEVVVAYLGRQHRVVVNASLAALKMLEMRISTLARSKGCAYDAGLPTINVPGRITIGNRRVPIVALESLGPGDVLLRVIAPATETALASGRRFTACAAWGTPRLIRAAAVVSIEGTSLTIMEEPFMTDDLESEDNLQPTLDSGIADRQILTEQAGAEQDLYEEFSAVPIGELELPIQFEIDTVTLQLAQVSALRPGYVIELHAPVKDARVRLVTHGQTIGHGEIVALGDNLGIRILRMAHDDGSVQ